ncbi:MAG: ComF family protein [Nitrospiraceae bacterium]|nr:ComF family protein [Nitrospiraceae bacterium]
MTFWRSAADLLLRGFFPSRCPACGLPSDDPASLPFCAACWRGISLSLYEGPACAICGEPLPSEHAIHCGPCLEDRPAYTKAFTFGLFEGALKEAIHNYKFAPARRLSAPLAGMLLARGLPPVHAVTAVPLSKKRLLERGFNQSMLIGRHIAKSSGAELLPHALRKVKETPPQAGLNRKERAHNLRGAFRANDRFDDMTILLIDDVITTGATVRECSKTLVKAGAKEVFVAAIARTKK